MELISRLVTRERLLSVEDHEESEDILTCAALDRLGSGKAFTGLLKGYGLQRGACATTMSWDSGDMIVVGCDARSMKTAADRIRVMGGGAVCAVGADVVSEVPAPLCGVISLNPLTQVAKEVRRLEGFLRDNGVRWESPLLTVDTLTTAAIPHIRITHHGYVRLKDRSLLPLEVEAQE
jgi:adenine deaminase